MVDVFLVFLHRERFWENLTTPLFGTLPSPSDTTEVFELYSLLLPYTSEWMCVNSRIVFTLSLVFWRHVRLS